MLKRAMAVLMILVVASIVPGIAEAYDYPDGTNAPVGRVHRIFARADGSVSIVLDTAMCRASNGQGWEGSMRVGARGMTADGLKTMTALMTAAQLAGKQVEVRAYGATDNGFRYCEIELVALHAY